MTVAVGVGDGIGPWTHPSDAALRAHSDGEAGVFRLVAGDCGPSVCSDPPLSTPPKRATRHSRRGDVIAITFHLGYLASGFAFAAIFASAYWRFHMNPIVAFWFAYIVTRPLGASFADWLGVSHARGGTRTRRRTSQPHRRNHHRGDGRRALLARSRRRNSPCGRLSRITLSRITTHDRGRHSPGHGSSALFQDPIDTLIGPACAGADRPAGSGRPDDYERQGCCAGHRMFRARSSVRARSS